MDFHAAQLSENLGDVCLVVTFAIVVCVKANRIYLHLHLGWKSLNLPVASQVVCAVAPCPPLTPSVPQPISSKKDLSSRTLKQGTDE